MNKGKMSGLLDNVNNRILKIYERKYAYVIGIGIDQIPTRMSVTILPNVILVSNGYIIPLFPTKVNAVIKDTIGKPIQKVLHRF